ncbi:MAG: ATPase domain-containing protein [Opitutaceae bacterium]
MKLFSSGCALLDCALGGGWPEGRIVNIVGDKSTGKTLLAIEATANFAALYPDGKIFYRETEAAFDEPYARSLGLPLDRVDMMRGLETVEDVFEDMEAAIGRATGPGLYILDSLDAVSDRAEQKRKIDEATFGGTKPKQMGQLFRRLTQRMSKACMTFVIISQTRDNIGVMFGERHTRTGGRALDFYASQIVWLAHLKQITRTVKKIKRVVGVQIRAKVKKNKIGPPFREADFPILFSYGMDDVQAACDWLEANGVSASSLVDGCRRWRDIDRWMKGLDDRDYRRWRARISKLLRREWDRVEMTFAPKRSKY